MPDYNQNFDPGIIGTPYAPPGSASAGQTYAVNYQVRTDHGGPPQWLFDGGRMYAFYPDGFKEVAYVAAIGQQGGQSYYIVPVGPWGPGALYQVSAGGGGLSGGGGGGISMAPIYQKISASYGFGGFLSGSEAAALESGMVSTDEWTQRMIGLRWTLDNRKARDQVVEWGRATNRFGKNEKISDADLFNLAVGTDNKHRATWEQAQAEAVAGKLGYDVGKDSFGALGRSYKDIAELVKAIPGAQTVADLLPVFQQGAAIAKQAKGWNGYKQYGLEGSDWEQIAAGVASADKVAIFNRIVGEQQEFAALRAPLQLAGISGRQGGLG